MDRIRRTTTPGLGVRTNPAARFLVAATLHLPSPRPDDNSPNGITVDSKTTTCELAEAVRTAYQSDGSVAATSPNTGETFTFSCQSGGSGTAGDMICQAQDGASTLYVLSHK